MVEMGLLFGQSLVAQATGIIRLFAKVSALYNVFQKVFCCLHLHHSIYKHFNMWLHFGPLNCRCLHSFRSVSLMVFEILEFKLKNKKNRRFEVFAISHMLVVQL